jgi:uncharacterized membrane protein YphA (DoxX/SURF4 family)
MKTVLNGFTGKFAAFVLMLTVFQSNLLAQDVKAEIKGEEVGSWFSQNWLWVSGLVLLLLILLLSGSARRARSTTTTTNSNGDVRRTTTTEVED